MKKSLLFSLLILIVLTSAAQGPTLSAANITPTVGSIFQNQYANTAGIDTLNGGANQTWDYSNLNDSNASVVLEVVTPESTPYADSFPGSNLSIKAGNDSGFIYFNSQSSELSELGIISPTAGSLKYTKPKVYLPYPFSYGNFFTDSVVEKSPNYNVVLRGKDSIYGNGYGTLKTPANTYINVLRVRYIENLTGKKDTSVDVGGISLPVTAIIKIRTVSYLYFTPDTRTVLLTNEVTTVDVSAMPFPGVTIPIESGAVTDISYLKNSILPLSFASFKAALNGKEISLQWQTAQEINTGHFTVERGLNSKDFTGIADTKAAGNTRGAHYNYIDQSYVKTDVPPAVYYRIKETDKDGKAFYSGIAVIHGNTLNLSIYPNPVRSYINFNSKDVAVADAITIFDAKGHIVQQLHNHPLSEPVNAAALSRGTYFIQIKLKDKTINTTLVKE